MKKIYTFLVVSLLFIGVAVRAQTFVHPGIPFTNNDLNQLKAHIQAGEEPWASSYASFASNSYSSLNYNMNGPYPTVGRASNVRLVEWQNDMRAIYNLSLMWVFTENPAYAQKATNILDAWAITNTQWTGEESFLALGDYCEYFVTGADILRSTYPGWTQANSEHVNNYFANVIWPQADVPNPVRPMNQGAIQLKIAISIAAYLGDPVKWDQALESFRTDIGGGLANSLANGQVGDAGRDEGHWRGQVLALAWSAEVAWKQGVDLFTELDNRILKAAELYCRYHLSTEGVEYIPFGGPYAFYGGYASDGTVKAQMTLYNIIKNAYGNRKGIATPFTDRFLDLKGQDANTFLFLKSADNSQATPLAAVAYPETTPAHLLTNVDIGNVGLGGAIAYGNNVWTVSGGGQVQVPPRESIDALNFSFNQVSGDAAIVARLDNIQQTGDGAVAGLMIRESLDPNSKYVGMFVNKDGYIETTWRGASAWSKTNQSWNFPQSRGMQSSSGPMPRWIKLERRGSRVAMLHSNDGIHWSGISEAEIDIANTAYIGLTIVSQNTSKLATAVFSNLSMTNTAASGSPIITCPTEATATIDNTFNFNISATPQATSYSATGLPSGLNINTTSGVITGTPTTFGTFLVTLTAANANGSGSCVLKVIVLNNTAPPAPSNFIASAVDTYNVALSWNILPEATSYEIKRGLSSGGPYSTIASGLTGTSFLDGTALPQGNYYIISAFTGELEGQPSSEVSILLLPNVPLKPTLETLSGTVSISWPVAQGALSYNVKRSNTKGGPYTVVAPAITGTTFSDTNVSVGQSYYYVVSSVSQAGESQVSPEESILAGASAASWAQNPASGNWATAGNWLSESIPADLAGVTFGNSAVTALTNNLNDIHWSRIIFSEDAPAYSFTGNPVRMGLELTNNSAAAHTISNDLILDNSLNINTGSGSITLNGAVSGTGALAGYVGDGGVITIQGNNTYSGGTTIYGNGTARRRFYINGVGTGTVGAPLSGPLGTGPIYLNNGCLSNAQASSVLIFNDLYAVSNTTNYLYNFTNNFEFQGRLLGNGIINLEFWTVTYSRFNLGGDNRDFEGTFRTIKGTSYFRMAFTSPTAGSKKAKWEFNPNFHRDCMRMDFNGTIDFGEFSGDGSMWGFTGRSPVLSIGALNTDALFSGVASDAISVIKVGTGIQRFTGANTYWGTTTVQQGQLLINNSFESAITVEGGTIGGLGLSSKTILVKNGGTIAPGDQGPGNFGTTNTLTLEQGATYSVEVSSSQALSDGLSASNVSLNNATLSLTDIHPGTLPLGSSFTIINNTGTNAVNGIFLNLPENAQVTVGEYQYTVTYKGGTGNDVVLLDERTTPSYILSPLNVQANVGQAFTYTLEASRALVAASASGLPSGLQINNQTGVISGTPTSAGTYDVAVSTQTVKDTITGVLHITVNTNAAPSAPLNVSLSANLAQITVTWSAVPATEMVTGYAVKRSTTDGGPYTILASGLQGTSYLDTSALYSTTYYYVVSATNSFGEGANSAQSQITTQMPPVPSQVAAAKATAGNLRVDLNWEGSTNAENYKVSRSTVAGGPYTVIAPVVNATSYTDTNVSNGTAYYYVVAAQNVSGVSSVSSEVTATPDASAYNWWPFNEGTGNTVTDVWGAKNGTFSSGSWVQGISGQGLNLNGASTNVVSLPSGIVQGMANYSVSAWVRPNAFNAWSAVFAFGYGSGTSNYMTLFVNNNQGLQFTLGKQGDEHSLSANNVLQAGKWAHVCVTQQGQVVTLYVNGIAVATKNNEDRNPANYLVNPTTHNYFGRSQYATPFLNAALDQVRIYNKALSVAQVQEMFYKDALKSPQNLQVAGAYNNVALTWEQAFGATAYNVKRATVSAGPYTTIASGVNATNYIDTTAGLATYYYVVTATGGTFETAPSAEVSIAITTVPNIPPVPQRLEAIAGNAKVSLRWEAAPEASSYTIKRATTQGGSYTDIATIQGLFYTDTGLTNGTDYYYTVSAMNVSGSSQNSQVATGRPNTTGILFYTLNEQTGTIVYDYFDTKNGTVAGTVQRTAGISGGAVRLGPTGNGHIVAPQGILQGLTQFTFSTWVKPESLTAWSSIFAFGYGAGTNNYAILFVNNTGGIRYSIGKQGDEHYFDSTVSLQTGKWSHVAVTQSGQTVILYINGVEVGRKENEDRNFANYFTSATTANYFGRSQYSGNNYLNAALDDIRMYNISLSAAQIAAIMASGAPTPPTNVTAQEYLGNVIVSWDAVPGVNKYTVKRATVSGGPYSVIASDVQAVSYTDISAKHNSFYYVISYATQTLDSAPSNEASVHLNPANVSNFHATGWQNRTDLSWGTAEGATSYNIKRSLTSGGPYQVVTSVTGTTYEDTSVANNTAYYYIIEAIGNGGISQSQEKSAIPVENQQTTTWKHADVGAVGVSGNAATQGDSFTVYGSGSDIYYQKDLFHFAYQDFNGDAAIVARVTSQENTRSYARAGIMIRDTLTTDAVSAAMIKTPLNMKEFIYREVAGTNAKEVIVDNNQEQLWLRLVRKDTVVSAYYSQDGLNWTLQKSQKLVLGATVHVGLVNCAANNAVINTSVFDNVHTAVSLPEISGNTTMALYTGDTVSYPITATNVPYIYSVTGLPAGLMLDQSTGLISGTVGQEGIYNVELSAVNAMGSALKTLTLTVSKKPQTIAFDPVANRLQGDDDFEVTAVATSGLPVTFESSDENVITVTGNTVHIVGPGSAVITASQGGNGEYYAAEPVVRTVTVNALNLQVLYKNADGAVANNTVKPYLKLKNNGTSAVNYAELTIRYWFTPENYSGINTWIDYAQLGTNKVGMVYTPAAQPRVGALGYIEYSFNPSAGILSPGGNSGEIQSRFANQNWANFNESDDHSYSNATSYIAHSNVTLYRNGHLVWGTEPAVVAPVAHITVYSQKVSSGNNTISNYLKLVNDGNTAFDYADLKVRYWFTKDGGSILNYWLDYAQLGNSVITGSFVPLNSGFNKADMYLELGFTPQAGKLYPLSSTGNIQQRITKSNWGNFDQSNDHSHNASAFFTANQNVTVYYKGNLIYGVEPQQFNAARMSQDALAETSGEAAIGVYPNPVESDLHIQLNGHAISGIRVTDMSGKLITIEATQTPEGYLLSMDGLPAGIYMVLIDEQGDTITTVKKIVKL